MDANPTSHGRANGRRYTVNEAAEILGISAEAVRARINRGTLPKEKDADGTVYVHLDAVHTHKDGRTNGHTNGKDAGDHTAAEPIAFQLMQDQVDYLRRQLEVWQEEARRKDHIIAALTERIPELEPVRDEPRGPETAAETTEVADTPDRGEGAQEDVQRPSWWRRFLGVE